MIEKMALQGDPTLFEAPLVMSKIRSCDFSFSGLKAQYETYINQEEDKQGGICA